jgi:hypothetical protein
VFLCLRWHPRLRFLGAAGLGVLVFSLASAFCLRASSVAPVRGGMSFRWLPRLRFLGAAGLVVLAFSLASALCLRAPRVAPVRGGTYFSLPPQRKVGKRKRLTPPTFLLA